MTKAGGGRQQELIRPGLLPGILGAVAAMAGLMLLGSDTYLIVRFAVSILALIIAVYAFQGRKWLWLLPLLAIAVVWNPVFPLEFAGTMWRAAHVLVAGMLLAIGVFLRVPERHSTGPS